ncbi:DnaJ domain-containing protein [Marinobacter sp. SS21]|uniref:DnaJ domain-containing protein n=1 Tax=Marinobacter sp. SS21 TaxID=2979460 RepID=UPI00232C5C27|nr:DnaJ domain-containing protein [Marinobacter sp. SS21]MDC0662338.1 molecular chaperone DnaJ [Marinobacter sp. SS21]
MQWVLGLALAAIVFVVLRQWGAMSPEQRKRSGWKLLLAGFAIVLIILVVTGRIHVITAGIAALLPLLKKLPALLRYWPLLDRWASQQRRDRPGGEQRSERESHRGSEHNQQQGGRHQQASGSGAMSYREACEVLGVAPDCTAEEVVAAHRRLIQKLHPDRGGTDYLAAKLNEAKTVLLRQRG